jgi:hypothetical protein
MKRRGGLSKYNFCIGAVILVSFRIVGGAVAGALFLSMAIKDVAQDSAELGTLGLSGGILTRLIGDAWITHLFSPNALR